MTDKALNRESASTQSSTKLAQLFAGRLWLAQF
jgi:hypothetical protein